MENNTLLWLGFNVFVILMLALDLGVFHRKAHEINLRRQSLGPQYGFCLQLFLMSAYGFILVR